MLKTVLLRLLRGFVAGAASSMVLVAPVAVSSVKDLNGWLLALSFAAVSGGLTGLILALDKAARYETTE